MGSLKNKKYCLIDKFLTPEETKLLTDYCRLKHRFNLSLSVGLKKEDQNHNMDSHFYADYLMESLMLNKVGLMEKTTGLELLPTYSFWRMYTKFADLFAHRDRPSCEYSVTVCIGSCGTKWPIYMDKKPIDLKPGQAVVYKGCEITHSRKEFQGDWQAQVFLHYVNKNGPNRDFVRDKRPFYGMPSMINNGQLK